MQMFMSTLKKILLFNRMKWKWGSLTFMMSILSMDRFALQNAKFLIQQEIIALTSASNQIFIAMEILICLLSTTNNTPNIKRKALPCHKKCTYFSFILISIQKVIFRYWIMFLVTYLLTLYMASVFIYTWGHLFLDVSLCMV